MSLILGIDPGDTESGYVLYSDKDHKIICCGKESNFWLLERLISDTWNTRIVCIEYPRPRGQPMYTQLVDTIFWVGRYVQALPKSCRHYLIDRKDVKMKLCGFATAKDSNVRAAIISRFKGEGSGLISQIGTKKNPGPLYGMNGDTWSALGVILTFCELRSVTD